MLAFFIDFPTVNTYGKTNEEAIVAANEALTGYLLTAEDYHLDFPNPTPVNDDAQPASHVLITVDTDSTRSDDQMKRLTGQVLHHQIRR